MFPKSKVGDIINLSKQQVTVESCPLCGRLSATVNIEDLSEGDLLLLKGRDVFLADPENKGDDRICVICAYTPHLSFGQYIREWFLGNSFEEGRLFSNIEDGVGGGMFWGNKKLGGMERMLNNH